MKHRIIVLAALSLCLTFAPSFAGAGESPKNFSADIVTTSAEGTASMKLYTSGEKSRMEMPGHIMIIRKDKQVMWIVMPEESMYMEQAIDPAMAAQTSADVAGEISRELVATEMMNGKNAQKFKVTYTSKGEKAELFQWIEGSGMPVRTQAVDGSWSVDFKNMQTGNQPDSLFEPPAGYQKMAMPSMAEMMKQAGQ